MGIALNVLRSCKVLNTPSGQLIIAAAMLQDVIGIILLAELKATKDFSFLEFIIPIISAVGMCAFFGWLAITIVPQAMQKHVLKRFHHHVDRQNIVLATILVASLALMPASHYARGSYLLGCFLAGLCFCTDHHTHPVWQAQVKRLLQWLMRLFFACTIGFEVRQRGFRRLNGAASCACCACCYARKHRSTVF
jgi:Kef-type K+ transport system membrane component KefB